MRTSGCDLLVVSHACVLASNQRTYAELARLGVDVHVVVPQRWRSEYAPLGYSAQVTAGLEGRVHPVRVVGGGRPQRHAYLTRVASILASLGPRTVFVEEEPFSVAAAQWSRAARSRGIPFGVQLAETLDRRLPAPLAASRSRVLRDATFVVARSPAASALAGTWGARCEVVVVAHGVDGLPARPTPSGEFTVAYVGRLVPEKGVGDLLAATTKLAGTIRLIVAGDGPLADDVRVAGAHVVALGAIPHDRIGDVYAQAHVTCVPSRSTPKWEEQFGRVLIESLVRAVPVVATRTGEIPWVIGETGGGLVVEESSPSALAAAILELAEDRPRASALGEEGRQGVLRHFTNEAAATTLRALLARLS